MKKVLAIAYNTFREAIRNKVLYILLIFAIVSILSSMGLGELTTGQQDKIIKDIGLGTINLGSIIIAVFIGISLIYNEIDKRSVYTILSKPVRRWQYLLGKYLGFLGTIYVIITLMALVFFVQLGLTPKAQFDPQLLIPIGYTYLELMIITAIAVMFSTFTTPILSGLYTLILFMSGRLCGDLERQIVKMTSKVITGAYDAAELPFIEMKLRVMKLITYIIPNLEKFDIRNKVVHIEDLADPASVVFNYNLIAYAVFYAAVMLMIGMITFNNRNLK